MVPIPPRIIRNANEFNKECAICLTNFDADTVCKVITCGHLFCQECIDEWLDKSLTCPTCRGRVIKPIITKKDALVDICHLIKNDCLPFTSLHLFPLFKWHAVEWGGEFMLEYLNDPKNMLKHLGIPIKNLKRAAAVFLIILSLRITYVFIKKFRQKPPAGPDANGFPVKAFQYSAVNLQNLLAR